MPRHLVDKTCDGCHGLYSTSYHWQKLCAPCRKAQRAKESAEFCRNKRRENGAPAVGSTLKCSDCGEGFIYKGGPMRRCIWCQKTYTVKKIREANERSGKLPVYRKNAKANYTYGGNKKHAVARDGFACRKCKTTEGLCVHHIDGRGEKLPKDEWNNDLDNLITLCATCHAAIHALTARELYARHGNTVAEVLVEFLHST